MTSESHDANLNLTHPMLKTNGHGKRHKYVSRKDGAQGNGLVDTTMMGKKES